jgi:hypothetical protein
MGAKMKKETWKNCSATSHGWALQALNEYKQEIGEKNAGYPAKFYGNPKGDYLTKIWQTKEYIFVEVV